MYLVIEIQLNGNNMAYIATTHQSREAAESKFHSILAAAATSSIGLHSAVMLNESGALMKRESYKHDG